MSNIQRNDYKAQVQEYLLKGYNGPRILSIINAERESKGWKPLNRSTIFAYMREIHKEGSKYYLDLAKDHTAYIILHRQKLLALDMYKKMIHDKIALAGGMAGINPDTLNRFVQTLLNITVTQSRLEREIPLLFNVQQNLPPEQVKEIEDEIVANLPKELRDQFYKEEARKKEEREKLLQEDPESKSKEELIDLDQYPQDTFVV